MYDSENHGSKLDVENAYNDFNNAYNDFNNVFSPNQYDNPLADIFRMHAKYTSMLAHQRPIGICAELDTTHELTIADLADFMLYMSHALQDEVHEMVDALGGIEDGVGSGSWKMWKKNHQQARTMKLTDLSDRDRQNLYMEIADMTHFFLSMVMATGMTAKDFYNYFRTKSLENVARQERGY